MYHYLATGPMVASTSIGIRWVVPIVQESFKLDTNLLVPKSNGVINDDMFNSWISITKAYFET